jgi:hypothetical protein
MISVGTTKGGANMIASQDFKDAFVRIARALERHLDRADVGTPLHIFLADRCAQVEMGEYLEKHGLLTPESEKAYQDAIEDRDYALREFGFDHDPLADPVRLN